jgi:hypothetical protein
MRFSLGGGKDDISARGAIGGLMDTDPIFEGGGGQGIKLAILAPIMQGSVPDYLPLYIQGLLNNNFKKFSGITLIDRQNLDQIIREQDLGVNGRFSDDDFVRIGSITNAQYCLVGTIQKLSGNKFSLSLSVTSVTTGELRANTTGNGALPQFEGTGTLVNAASADLLEQMGVQLTSRGKQALLAGNDSVVKAETGLARGIIAQQGNKTVTALFNFTQALIFNPSQTEALNRLDQLSLAISGGTTSERILSDLQARDQWFGIFKETAFFFENHAPFEITFDPNLIQDGDTDFSKRTANLQMRVSLDPSPAAFDAINTLLEGLESTGRRRAWGFNGWPFSDIEPRAPEVVVFAGATAFSYKVDVALLNDKGTELGRSNITLNSSSINFSAGDTRIATPAGDKGLIQFQNVKADDLTPVLTIIVLAVNGEPSRTLNARGYMRITPADLEGNTALLQGKAATMLKAEQWAEGNIDDGGENWYSINVTANTSYQVWVDDRDNWSSYKTGDVGISAYYSDGAEIWINRDDSWDYPETFTAIRNDTVYIKVFPSKPGSYGIVYSTGTVRPR